MIATIHQPEYLPWLGFFDKMHKSDVMVLLDTVQFARQDFQNRNRIKGYHGPMWVTVPVETKGRTRQTIREVQICNDRDWRRKSWNSLLQNYRRAPHFGAHERFFADLYNRDWTRLVELNVTIIRYLVEQFGIETRLVLSSELDIHERGGTKVALAACRAVGAQTYLSGPFGRDYLDEDQFERHSIHVEYHHFQHPKYPQLFGEFVPKMSSIDLLFNCGENGRALLRGVASGGARCLEGSTHD